MPCSVDPLPSLAFRITMPAPPYVPRVSSPCHGCHRQPQSSGHGRNDVREFRLLSDLKAAASDLLNPRMD